MSDPVYCYPPDFTVLVNKLGMRDAEELDQVERALVVQRLRQKVPTGRFDLAHLRAIHRHLFQDVYDWAGELRTVEISRAPASSSSGAISRPAWPMCMVASSKGVI